MGRAAAELRRRRLADHRHGRRRRRFDRVLMYGLGLVALLLLAGMALYCVDAALHPWWTRTAPAQQRGR